MSLIHFNPPFTFYLSVDEDPESDSDPGNKDVEATPTKTTGTKRTRPAVAKVPFSCSHHITLNKSQHQDQQAPEDETRKKRTRATITSDTLSGGIPYTSSLRQAVSSLATSHASTNASGKTRGSKSPSLSVSSDESVAKLPEDFQVNAG